MKIYVITNTVNGKKYVGQTIKAVSTRWRAHCNSENCIAIHRAIEKHGVNAFELEVVQECTSLDELNQAEIDWINKLNSKAPNGYNIKDGGTNGKMSEESKAKMKFVQNHRSQEWKENMKKANSNKSAEWRANISKSKMGQKCSPKQLENLKKGREGKHRGAKGERNSHCKLTAEIVTEIRKLYDTGQYTQQQMADKFGVNQTNVGFIVRRVHWSHIL